MLLDKKIFHCFYYDLDIGTLSPVKDSIFDYLKDYSALYLDCGRSSLRDIGSLFGEGEILVPDYTCASVIQSFIPPLKQKYYHINDDFTIDFDSLESLITPEVKLICVSQFCGKLLPKDQVKRLIEIRNKYGIKL